MGKRIFALTIVLLYQLTIINQASAGFYDWLISPEKDSLLVDQADNNLTNVSFDKVFSWTNRKPENTELNNLLLKEAELPSTAYTVVSEAVRQVTAYNVGDPYQTDSTPCIGAYPKVNLCDEVKKGVRVCAANFVPLNTILRITNDENESFECIVWDRMNSRYTKRVDIAMSLSDKSLAKQFGLNHWKVEILEEDSI